MAQGTVKWFNDAKGYGFITQEAGDDVFVHFNAIQAQCVKSPAEGDKGEFAVTKRPKGRPVANVGKIKRKPGVDSRGRIPTRVRPPVCSGLARRSISSSGPRRTDRRTPRRLAGAPGEGGEVPVVLPGGVVPVDAEGVHVAPG